MSAEAEHYARVADGFGQRVRAVGHAAWDAPAPCDGWVARDVVDHLVQWVPGFFAGFAALESPAMPPVADDPAAAWAALDDVLRGWFADPAVADREINGPMGPTTVAGAIEQFVTPDVLIHTWDLARATGLDDRLDPAEMEHLVVAMEPMDTALRASGHFGPRVPIDPNASAQDRLLAFVGRDPHWVA